MRRYSSERGKSQVGVLPLIQQITLSHSPRYRLFFISSTRKRSPGENLGSIQSLGGVPYVDLRLLLQRLLGNLGPGAQPHQSQRRLSALILHAPQGHRRPQRNDRGRGRAASRQRNAASEPSSAPTRATGSTLAAKSPRRSRSRPATKQNSKAELYNVDVRHDQRYLAEHDIFPCGDRDESRFSPDFQVLLTSLELQAAGDPSMPRDISRIEVLDGRKQRLEGAEGQILFLLQIKGLAEGTNFQVLHGIWAR